MRLSAKNKTRQGNFFPSRKGSYESALVERRKLRTQLLMSSPRPQLNRQDLRASIYERIRSVKRAAPNALERRKRCGARAKRLRAACGIREFPHIKIPHDISYKPTPFYTFIRYIVQTVYLILPHDISYISVWSGAPLICFHTIYRTNGVLFIRYIVQ